jgi:cation transport ATPase
MGQSFFDHPEPHPGDSGTDHDHGPDSDHGHDHGHSHGAPGWGYALYCLAVGALLLLYVTGVFTRVLGFDVALLVTVVAGFPLLRHALDDLLHGNLSSHLTIAIAAGAAVAIGQYFAAAEVMFIMLLGEGLEHFTVHRAAAPSRASSPRSRAWRG